MSKYTKKQLKEMAIRVLVFKKINIVKYNQLRYQVALKSKLSYGQVEYKIIRLSEGMAA